MRLDKEYWEFWKNFKDKDYVWKGYLDNFLDYWEGCTLCACDHGCNSFILQNAVKMQAILEALVKGVSGDELDLLVQRDEKEFVDDLHSSIWESSETES